MCPWLSGLRGPLSIRARQGDALRVNGKSNQVAKFFQVCNLPVGMKAIFVPVSTSLHQFLQDMYGENDYLSL